ARAQCGREEKENETKTVRLHARVPFWRKRGEQFVCLDDTEANEPEQGNRMAGSVSVSWGRLPTCRKCKDVKRQVGNLPHETGKLRHCRPFSHTHLYNEPRRLLDAHPCLETKRRNRPWRYRWSQLLAAPTWASHRFSMRWPADA